MGVLDWLFGSTRETPGEAPQPFPWERGPSIYEHITRHIRVNQRGLAEDGLKLPDEAQIASKSSLRYAPGAMDGISTHHMGGVATEQARQLLQLVRTYSTSPKVANKAKVYEFLVENRVVALLDPFLESLRVETGMNLERLYDLARSFATLAPDREPVKFGIALLGLFGREQDLDIFRTIGRHEEFTLFCAVALGNSGANAERELWELAKHVTGWGRIHLVERLAKTEEPDIQGWLLREGYKNSIMYEYLAYPCAVAGGLRAALERDDVDDDLLLCAADILQALIAHGPAQNNIDDYEDGGSVVQLFLKRMAKGRRALVEFLAVNAIGAFLQNEAADWHARGSRGWTPEKREAMLGQCSEIVQQPHWRERILAGLRSRNEEEFYHAGQAAAVLHIDAWPFHWERLQEEPLQSGRWFWVMRDCNNQRIAQVLALAEATLPLAQIASGPATELGFGPEFEPHRCLGHVLQELGKFPRLGVHLLEAGLRCPTIRNRHMALKALSEWGKDAWPAHITSLLNEVRDREPDPDLRRRLDNVIAGRPLEQNG